MRFAATDKLKGQIKLGFIVLFSSGDGENAVEMGNRVENIADGGTPIYTQELKEKKNPDIWENRITVSDQQHCVPILDKST